MSKGLFVVLGLLVLEVLIIAQLISSFGFLNVLIWLIIDVAIGVYLIRKSVSNGRAIYVSYIFAGSLFLIPGLISDVLACLILLFHYKMQGVLDRISNEDFFKVHMKHMRERNWGNEEPFATDHNEQENPYGQPKHQEQPKSDLQKARMHFQSKRPIIDAEYESAQDDDKKD